MDDFYGRDWAEHRHKLFDAIGAVLRILNPFRHLREKRRGLARVDQSLDTIARRTME